MNPGGWEGRETRKIEHKKKDTLSTLVAFVRACRAADLITDIRFGRHPSRGMFILRIVIFVPFIIEVIVR